MIWMLRVCILLTKKYSAITSHVGNHHTVIDSITSHSLKSNNITLSGRCMIELFMSENDLLIPQNGIEIVYYNT